MNGVAVVTRVASIPSMYNGSHGIFLFSPQLLPGPVAWRAFQGAEADNLPTARSAGRAPVSTVMRRGKGLRPFPCSISSLATACLRITPDSPIDDSGHFTDSQKASVASLQHQFGIVIAITLVSRPT